MRISIIVQPLSIQSKKMVSAALALSILYSVEMPPCTAQNQSIQTSADAKRFLQTIFSRNNPNARFSDQIPSNFPVPNYPSVTSTNFCHSTKGIPTASASLFTQDAPAKVFDWYQSTLRNGGWTTKIPSAKAMNGVVGKEFFIIHGDKDKNQIYVNLSPNKQTGGTIININWSKKSTTN